MQPNNGVPKGRMVLTVCLVTMVYVDGDIWQQRSCRPSPSTGNAQYRPGNGKRRAGTCNLLNRWCGCSLRGRVASWGISQKRKQCEKQTACTGRGIWEYDAEWRQSQQHEQVHHKGENVEGQKQNKKHHLQTLYAQDAQEHKFSHHLELPQSCEKVQPGNPRNSRHQNRNTNIKLSSFLLMSALAVILTSNNLLSFEEEK